MSRETPTKKLKNSKEKIILEVLRDKQEQEHLHAPLKKEIGLRYIDLKNKIGLNDDSLSKALKSLQRNDMAHRDFETRRYSITPGGLKTLKVKGTVDIIMEAKTVKVETVVPVDSIVAVDAPNLSKAQQQRINEGTLSIATAAFNQLLRDLQDTKGSLVPRNGRIVYTASIDLEKAKHFLESDKGKEYVLTFFKGVPETEKKGLPSTS